MLERLVELALQDRLALQVRQAQLALLEALGPRVRLAVRVLRERKALLARQVRPITPELPTSSKP